MVITNGFTYVAFLMFLGGGLLALQIRKLENLQSDSPSCMGLRPEHGFLHHRTL